MLYIYHFFKILFTPSKAVFIVLFFVGSVGTGHLTKASAQSFSPEFSRGVELYQRGAYGQAIPIFRHEIEKKSNNIDAFIYLSSSFLGDKQYEQVIKTAQKGLDISPGHIRLMLLEAEAYYRTDYKKAIPIYEKIASRLENEENLQQQDISVAQIKAYLGHLYQRKASELYKASNFNKGITDYRTARNYSPDSLNIHNNLAYVLLQQKKWDEAIKVLEKATSRFPDSEQLLMMKGQAYRGAKELQKMTDTYLQLYKKDEDNLNYALIYGQSLMASNQAQRANAFLNKLVRKHPNEEKLYEALKKMNEQRFDFAAKRNILKLQRQAFPENTEVAEELAETYIQTKEFELSRQVYDSLATTTKDIRFAIASAHTWLYQEDYQKADSVYHKLTNKYPEQQQILVEGARVSERIEEKERALILLKEAYAIGEKPEIALNIAELLTDQKKENEAISYTRKLVGTRYGGIAIFYELKYAQKKLDEAGKKAEQALLKMFQLYASLQQELSGEAENVFESRQLRMPPLLQNKHKITQLNQYIDNWYNYLMDNFSVPQAEGIIAAVCSEYPESPKLHLFEGKIAFRAGHSTLAQESFEKAIRQGARDPEIYFLLGEVYRDRNKYSKSILSYERALTTDASFEKAYQKIVQTSEQQGSLDELCDRWLRRYKNNSDNKMLREYLISALHKADRFEEAKQIIKEG